MTDSAIYEECPNGLAVITIDRPKTLNAANIKVVTDIRDGLAKCKGSETAKALLIMGAGEKGFSSGGDVKALHGPLKEDPKSVMPLDQLFHEYSCLYEFRQMSIPTVSLVHGITMGFGMGLGASSRYAIATEKSRFAMPENNIGLFPDACFPFLAANVMPEGLGRLMAVTGVHLIGAGDVLAAKLATHYAPFEQFPALIEGLKAADLGDADAAVKACIEGFTEAPPAPKLLGADSRLPAQFAAAESLADALAKLASEAVSGGWAAELQPLVAKGCPFSQATVWKLLQATEADAKNAALSQNARLAASLERDFAVANRIVYRPDFVEGIRAVLVDKDNAPKWQPATLAEVSEEEVEATLAPLPEGVRTLGLPK